MPCSIYYASFYGSTQQYAEELARRVGATAEPIPQRLPVAADTGTADTGAGGSAEHGSAAGPAVVLAPAHGPMNEGVKFLRSLDPETLEQRPFALATVGMTLDEEVEATDPTAALLGPLASSVTRFYLPGRLYYSELSAAHRNVMRGLVTALKLKPGKTENERNIIASYGEDIDRVDFARLDPIAAWVEANQP